MSSYDVRCYRSIPELAAISDQWTRLLLKSDRPDLRQRPDWLAMSVEMGDARAAAVAALFSGSELVGVAPFLERRGELSFDVGYRHLGRVWLRTADFSGESWLGPQDDAAATALVRGALEAAGDAEVVRFFNVPSSGPYWRALTDRAFLPSDRHWTYYPDDGEMRRLIRVDATFDGYLAKFGSRPRGVLKRSARKLRDACNGELRLERITRRDQVVPMLTKLEELTKKTWKGQVLGQVIGASPAEIDRLSRLADRGWLRSYLLLRGEEPLAFSIGRFADGVFYYDTIGYDEAWQPYAPGKTLLYMIIENLCSEEGAHWLDFRHGDAEYKEFFSTDGYAERSVCLVRKSLRPAAAFALHGALGKSVTGVKRVMARADLLERVRGLRRRLRRTA